MADPTRQHDEEGLIGRPEQPAARLVLCALESALAEAPDAEFLLRRARAELEGLPAGDEARQLRRLLVLAGAAHPSELRERIADQLVAYAAHLESRGLLDEASALVTRARRHAPGCVVTALHGARLARKAGDPALASALYARVSTSAGDTHLGRLAAIGEALLEADADAALGRASRRALRARDGEAAAVALEERAALRRAAGRTGAAVRDLAVAAFRYADAKDRGRVTHQIADLLHGRDALAAREALLAAVAIGESAQREQARARLWQLSNALGDELGALRWRSSRPALVSLGSRRARPIESRLCGRARQWRLALEGRSVRPAVAAEVAVEPVALRLETSPVQL